MRFFAPADTREGRYARLAADTQAQDAVISAGWERVKLLSEEMEELVRLTSAEVHAALGSLREDVASCQLAIEAARGGCELHRIAYARPWGQ